MRRFSGKISQREFFSVIASALIAAISCSGGDEPSHLDVDDPVRHVTISMIGGFATCRGEGFFDVQSPLNMVMMPHLLEIVGELKAQGHDVSYLAICHAWTDGDWRYVQDDQTDVVMTTADGMIALLTQAALERPAGTEWYMIGYSYGGWLAMKTLALLPYRATASGLFTIDPISMTCRFTSFWSAACRQAPAEFADLEGLDQVRPRTKRWDNFHQAASTLLHSSSIPAADRNVLVLKGDGTWQGYEAHVAIATEQSIWDDISAAILNSEWNQAP